MASTNELPDEKRTTDSDPTGLTGPFPETPYYDPETIADEAVWPLIDELWHGDWRREATSGNYFCYPKTGVVNMHRVDVNIMAEQMVAEDPVTGEIEPEHLSKATVSLEEVVSGPQRDFILDAAKEDQPETFEGVGDEDGLTAKDCVSYGFDTDGDLDISLFKIVEDVDGEYLWKSEPVVVDEEDEEDQGDSVEFLEDSLKIRDYDMEQLMAAFVILGASPQIIDDLEAIKNEPINPAPST